MIYSNIHSLMYRVKNKLSRTHKRKIWNSIPLQSATTYKTEGVQLFEPQLVGPSTLIPECVGSKTAREVLAIMEKLEPEPYIDFVKGYYRKGLESFGDAWVYADINTVLYAICKATNIKSYLEIGVRRGRSMSVVATASPKCDIVGFDLWIPDYCGVDNPGQDFVKGEVAKTNHQGSLGFVAGNSRETIPQYFREHPDKYFDLVTVDGDHSVGGAIADLKNVMPRIKIGGFLVFDDISSPEHPYLKDVWNKVVSKNKGFTTYEFTELGLGVAFAIRRY